MSLRHLDALFKPKSIAFIGASDEPGRIGFVVTRNLLYGGFRGPIMPVTRRFKAVAGVLAYPNVASLPLVAELAVIGTPPEPVPELVAELGEQGTRAAIVLTAGMSDTRDGRGQTVQAVMLKVAKGYGLRILGPNSLGLLVPAIGLNASFSHRPALRGNLAFVSQSGAMCTGVLDWARSKGIGFSHFISLGECADLGFDEVLDYLATEPATRAILLYVEAIDRSRRFMSAARAAARNKPVLAIKAGRVSEAIQLAASHIGAHAGSDAVFDAAFRRAGMLRVFDTEELFAAVETLARARPLKGERLAIMTNGAGIAVLAVDALIQGGGSLAELSESTRAELDAVLPPIWSRGNPVDMIGDATEERYANTLRILLAAREVDAVLVMHAPTAVTSSVEAAEAVIQTASERSGNVLTCWVGEEAVAPARQRFAAAGIPTYESPGMAVRAFLHIVHYRRNQELLMQTPRSVPLEFIPSMDVARKAVKDILASGRDVMTDPQAKVVLHAYGIPTLPTCVAREPREAARMATQIGYPVAVKLLSPDLRHRLNAGGVALDLTTPASVQASAEGMMARLQAVSANARLDGFSVQKMVNRREVHELLVGVRSDPIFGPVLLFGQGGSAADVINDIAIGLPPLNMHLARELISRTRIFRVLEGYHGHTAADIDAITLTLVKLSQLIIDIPEISEVQINPLWADPRGVLAVETRIHMQLHPQPAHERLAIRPYPQHLEENFVLKDGRVVRLRPIRPEDEPQHHEFIAKLTREDIRLRFFGYIGRLPHAEMARLTQIDYDREMAFIATAPDATGKSETLGEVRTLTDPDNTVAEYAVVVRSDVKGAGLGRKLMEKMIDYCRARGIRTFAGQVLRENRRMLALVETLGFHRKYEPDDTSVYDVWLDL